MHPAAKAAARHLSHASFHNSKHHAPSCNAQPCIHTNPRADGGARQSHSPEAPHRHTSNEKRNPDWYW